MELTRRDALRAAVAGTAVTGTTMTVVDGLRSNEEPTVNEEGAERDIQTLSRVADVVYPSDVETTPEFIETYVLRLNDQRQAELSKTVAQLNRVTRSRYGREFVRSSSRSRCEAMLHSLGVHRVESDPAGTVPERVRYHLVNTLLYALFTSPTGSELVGIESPMGYPGGFAVYRTDEEQL